MIAVNIDKEISFPPGKPSKYDFIHLNEMDVGAEVFIPCESEDQLFLIRGYIRHFSRNNGKYFKCEKRTENDVLGGLISRITRDEDLSCRYRAASREWHCARKEASLLERRQNRDEEIYSMRRAGATYRAIAKKYGMHPSGAHHICRRQTFLKRKQYNESLSSRPLDMGGERDIWHEWTPEMQLEEFKQSYASSGEG